MSKFGTFRAFVVTLHSKGREAVLRYTGLGITMKEGDELWTLSGHFVKEMLGTQVEYWSEVGLCREGEDQ